MQPEFNELPEEYRVLPLSQTWNNMQMWVHYANNYDGICIAFKNKDVLKEDASDYVIPRFESL